jgi:hypothetical protein
MLPDDDLGVGEERQAVTRVHRLERDCGYSSGAQAVQQQMLVCWPSP